MLRRMPRGERRPQSGRMPRRRSSEGSRAASPVRGRSASAKRTTCGSPTRPSGLRRAILHNRGHGDIRRHTTAGRASRSADARARDCATDRGARGAARGSAAQPSAWPRSSATPCSWRSTCWSRIPICADSSAPSSSGWSTIPRRTPAACGSLDDTSGTTDLWMANISGETLMADSAGWASLDLPRESMSRHLAACEEGHAAIVEYEGDDARLPWPVRDFNQAARREIADRRAAASAAEDPRLDCASRASRTRTASGAGGGR